METIETEQPFGTVGEYLRMEMAESVSDWIRSELWARGLMEREPLSQPGADSWVAEFRYSDDDPQCRIVRVKVETFAE
jgi:hypothetical protein